MLSLLLAVYLTWPQAQHLKSQVASNGDAFFSLWRISWIAHALATDPQHLYDGNIFYPEQRTLAYSDATLLEGALAAPFMWMGAPPTTVYNLLLILAIAGSGVAMFVLARDLVGNASAALVSAAIFTLAPYRVLHFIHLELQWTMWIPLALWGVHRAVAERSWRAAAMTGVFLWLQVLSCVYYGMFTAIALLAVGTMLLVSEPRRAIGALPFLVVAAIVATVLTIPYARPYLENARTLGERTAHEVSLFSATPLSYITWPEQNWLWGWTGERFMGHELRLAPGVIALALAAVGVFGRKRRTIFIYVALCALAVELSFGSNGWLYPLLTTYAAPFRSLRAPARFGIVACGALAILIGFGVERLQSMCRRPEAARWIVVAAIGCIALESGSAPLPLMRVPLEYPDVYRYIAGLGPSVIAEFPMPPSGTDDGYDPYYEFFSRYHWKPLVNGYSGYRSNAQIKSVEEMAGFPDETSIARLRSRHVRFVVVHQHLYSQSEFASLMLRIGSRPELVSHGRYRDWVSDAQVFELMR